MGLSHFSYLKSIDNYDDLELNNILKNNQSLKIGISWKSVFNIYGGLKSLELGDFKQLFSNERTLINLQCSLG